jgi:hypothetical protein
MKLESDARAAVSCSRPANCEGRSVLLASIANSTCHAPTSVRVGVGRMWWHAATNTRSAGIDLNSIDRSSASAFVMWQVQIAGRFREDRFHETEAIGTHGHAADCRHGILRARLTTESAADALGWRLAQ